MNKYSGVLLSISSLPSKHGIGTLGKEAYKFVDFLKKAGQSYWQILPIGPTGFGDSPYQSFSTYAGNPYFIDLDILKEEGLISDDDLSLSLEDSKIDYGELYLRRFIILRKAVANFIDNDDYYIFLKNNDYWLNDYCLFMALKDNFKGCDWLNWPKKYRLKDEDTMNHFIKANQDDIRFYKVIQYLFFKQWFLLKEYANRQGIKIFGDCPIYVSMDSCDVWANKELFKLRKSGTPKEIAGVPPDMFSQTGQLWGNPLYNWHYLKKNNYDWWIKRLKHLFTLYDTLRIDHFIGIDSYYAIKYGDKDALNGKRYKGPGYSLIKTIKKELPDADLIAEDLGLVTDSVKRLMKRSKLKGMRVLRFGFGDNLENCHLIHNHSKNVVAYLTSHDTETCLQWFDEASEEEKTFIRNYFNFKDDKEINWQLIEELMKSKAYLTIIQAQDLLGLGKEARINFPSTLGGNWIWRLNENQLDDIVASRLYKTTKKSRRIGCCS